MNITIHRFESSFGFLVYDNLNFLSEDQKKVVGTLKGAEEVENYLDDLNIGFFKVEQTIIGDGANRDDEYTVARVVLTRELCSRCGRALVPVLNPIMPVLLSKGSIFGYACPRCKPETVQEREIRISNGLG